MIRENYLDLDHIYSDIPMADETREARNYMSNVILANLDGWGEEYEQIRQNARIK